MTTTSSSPTLAGAGLEALNERVRFDLACLNLPPANWVPARTGEQGEHVHDVVIIGGGQCGLVAAFALMSGGIRNLRIFDRNPQGLEGPWLNYARMETLRSPKTLPGPSYGFASLTFRAWYEAQYGNDAWEALDKIPRPTWMAYLSWYREVLALPVENGVNVEHVTPEGDLLRLELSGDGAPAQTVLTRKLIMATGRDGTGGPKIPGFVEGLPQTAWAHTADDVDFAALEGKRVIVVGVGASAVDNAAEALEHGASEVRFLIRRAQMPTINKMMGIGSFGFTHGYAGLSDDWRWRIMHYSFITQTPPPRGSTMRVSRHENAFFHFECGVEATRMEGDEIVVTTRQGEVRGDFLILGTGFEIDPLARTELAGYADRILLWRDCYQPPKELAHDELGKFPYVGRDFAFQEREPGSAPWLKNIHCFNYGASVSLGKVSGDIPGISEGASWLASAIASRFYQEDVERHWQQLQHYDAPELQGDEWTASPLPND
ncbi:NAD(P)/FAD-dependent oxidoreductase [Halomonas sp. PAMB 3264]|uniref:NAD(P)/FAD-dependent oxidoreductase n=1 Tax=Halomonas sp. PAMB 3264 TaxID=3075222 RepID=UPI00289BE1F1|nr:NAD(P)/FAD-dependent oxidoreductase [Halomonas sp. PAMB 3264]WNL41401.1 NAD(P)/FAD-dependent oxidoreductase [Halomonas sp. PAMB 3264]